MILAIDTATDSASVALSDGSEVVAELSWSARGNHSRHLAEVVRYLTSLVAVPLTAVERIAVSSGPGSFSGLRVGVSTAKGLAMGLDVPLVGISTLDIIGYQASRSAERVWAMISAGRAELYLGQYEGQQDHWRRIADLERVSLDWAVQSYVPGTLLAGPAGPTAGALISESGAAVQVEPSPWRVRRASFLAELGTQYFDAGGDDRRESLELTYLRRSSAEERREPVGSTD